MNKSILDARQELFRIFSALDLCENAKQSASYFASASIPNSAVPTYAKDHIIALEAMVEELKTVAKKLSQLENIEKFERSYVDDVLIKAQEHVRRSLKIAKLLYNSTTSKIAHELYLPVNLILSSLRSKDSGMRDLDVIFTYSESFSPTMMGPLPILNDVIIITVPEAECNNPLILPLAGHELGHYIFQNISDGKSTDKNAVSEMNVLLSECGKLAKEKCEAIEDFIAYEPERLNLIIATVSEHAMLQLEEIFCDIVGLSLFGISYLKSFCFLLLVSEAQRNPKYPSHFQRVDFLLNLALSENSKSKALTEAQWSNFFEDKPSQAPIVILADEIRRELAPKLVPLALSYLPKDINVLRRDLNPEDAVHAISRGCPPSESIDFVTVIEAGWQLFSNSLEQGVELSLSEEARKATITKREAILKAFEANYIHHALTKHRG